MKIDVRSLTSLAASATFLLSSFSLWSQSTTSPVGNAVIRSNAAAPGVRMTSGLMICDEELYRGRWVNRYWTATGQIKPDFHMEGQSQERAGLPIDA
ncbi:MAG: hypothetical protein WA510_22515, partial [Acidobacteriaceae bacterium]